MLSKKKIVSVVVCGGLSSLIAFPANALTNAVEQFKTTWVAKALSLQREIDIDTPLNQSTFLGTHNSENASYYAIPFVRYVDPNQILSIYDQLEMGMRSVEFDVHWYLGAHFAKDILLCHGLNDHLGCSSFDRPVTEGLVELRDWLSVNKNEVVILYFDRTLDHHEPRLLSYLESYVGQFIYRPSAIRKANDAPGSCMGLPGTITKSDILKAGKQLLIVTKDCDGPSAPYEEKNTFPGYWNDDVFVGIGKTPADPYAFLDSTYGDDFTPYPDCAKSTLYASDPEHASLWRIFEDRTIISNIVSPHKKLLADEMRLLVRCGINLQTMDMLSVDDDRLAAAIWSWEPSFPVTGRGECAVYKRGKGIENAPCTELMEGFACQNASTHAFQAITSESTWKDGEAVCQSIAGTDWHFATPINGNQMYLFQQSAAASSASAFWLNYSHTQDHWRANKIVP